MAKILIVDDDSAMQLTIRLLLERAGHHVVTADDGRKGLAQFQAGDFDLLFVDTSCPAWTGSKPCGWSISRNRKRRSS